MDTKTKLLQIKNRMKKRKPTFGRKDNNKKKRIESDVWRKARGCDNKQRLKRKGHKRGPRSGFRTPVLVRGLHMSGLEMVRVNNVSELSKITKTQGIIIANVGNFKRKMILEHAAKHAIKVFNLDAKKAIEQIDAKLAERKAKKKDAAAKKLDDEKKAESKKEKKSEKKETLTEHTHNPHEPEKTGETKEAEEQKAAEKEEKDKVITKRN